ncbi:hypothetical protein SYNPS1DRAFT_23865 [Syncephalis pseudoplumigaleata]|uniref:Uncharacterized protein n=1 Tax=Syncephalis pseudoplumigaleata TaxID=1712513 RepID=A0A4P9YXI6_9FUNG|nr:hypothetical protein SYNPS1DRAFT_23865 [Syncephalis pseudoplumigaleata]|eukprot:RKP24041.1 hypothetical protein SYNPS1DRAFT_23865 [Syncephalis pseudoplumigaleata]
MDLDATATANVSLSRREEEMLRRDRTLAETLLLMDNCRPIIPDAVTDYYLARSGLDCQDVRM